MSKRALVVGCNYPNTDNELQGCVNDVLRMKEMLLKYYGFHKEDIVLMIDTDKNYPQPTGANIRKALSKIVANTKAGDVLVMHFSGHGEQMNSESGIPDDTGMDECIVPTDLNNLTDDDFREIVNTLPAGVTFTLICDCCHSGGLIDHEKEQIGNSTTGSRGVAPGISSREFHLSGYAAQNRARGNTSREYHPPTEYGRGYGSRNEDDRREDPRSGGIGGVSVEGNRRSHESEYEEKHESIHSGGYSSGHVSGGGSRAPCFKNRGLSMTSYMSMLGQKTGTKVTEGAIRTTLYSAFGKDASPMVQMFVGVLIKHGPAIMSQLSGNGNRELAGILSTVTLEFVKSQMEGRPGGPKITDALAHMTPLAQQAAQADDDGPVLAGWKPPPGRRVSVDMGILVSGCQAKEKSADVRANGSTKAFGALSNAIQTAVAAKRGKLTNRELVMDVRALLKKQGFEQNPGLYCSDKNVNAPFICD